jgi:glycosyltransferase 2 family protein
MSTATDDRAPVPPALRQNDHSSGHLREELAGRPQEPRPARRRRGPLGRIAVIGLTLVAVSGLLGQIGSLGAIVDALRRANWPWVIVALGVSALTFPAAAVGLRAGYGNHVTLRTGTALQLASKFANLMAPAGLGSTALTVGFQGRAGIDATSALTTDVAMGLVSGVVEVGLALVCAWIAGRHLDLGGLPPGTGRVALIAVLAIGVIAIIAAGIPRVRAAIAPHLRRMWDTLRGLARSPRRTLTIAASSLLTVTLYSLCLAACVHALGGDVSFATVVVVNWAATTIGNVAPVPGGLGVAEAGLVAGLTAAGVPTDVAVAAALTHRLATFWLPPIAGWFALRHLRRRELV